MKYFFLLSEKLYKFIEWEWNTLKNLRRTKRNLDGSHSTAGRMPKDFDKDLLYAILKKNRMDFLVYRFLVEKFKISLECYGNLTSSATNKLGL